MGSEKAKKGRAKFMKPFLNDSSFLCPWMILMSSRHTRPTTAAVVVAIAGMILPAISLLWQENKGSVSAARKHERLETLVQLLSVKHWTAASLPPCVYLLGECRSSLPSGWMLLR